MLSDTTGHAAQLLESDPADAAAAIAHASGVGRAKLLAGLVAAARRDPEDADRLDSLMRHMVPIDGRLSGRRPVLERMLIRRALREQVDEGRLVALFALLDDPLVVALVAWVRRNDRAAWIDVDAMATPLRHVADKVAGLADGARPIACGLACDGVTVTLDELIDIADAAAAEPSRAPALGAARQPNRLPDRHDEAPSPHARVS